MNHTQITTLKFFQALGELETVLNSITPPECNSLADVIGELVESSVENGYDILLDEKQPRFPSVSQGVMKTFPRRVVTQGGLVVWVAVDEEGLLRVISKDPFHPPHQP